MKKENAGLLGTATRASADAPPSTPTVRFRPHRGGFAEALAEASTFHSLADLQSHLDRHGLGQITAIEDYGFDGRAGWNADTFIVITNLGPVGFTDGLLWTTDAASEQRPPSTSKLRALIATWREEAGPEHDDPHDPAAAYQDGLRRCASDLEDRIDEASGSGVSTGCTTE